MRKYWITQTGEEIEYSKLENSHLLNILKWIEKKAEDGIIQVIGGNQFDIESLWYDEVPMMGEEVKEYYNYKGLQKEAIKRNLLNSSQLTADK